MSKATVSILMLLTCATYTLYKRYNTNCVRVNARAVNNLEYRMNKCAELHSEKCGLAALDLYYKDKAQDLCDLYKE